MSHRGDSGPLPFPPGLDVTFDGRPYGTVPDPSFGRVVLVTFLGPAPAGPDLKRALPGDRPA